jgi:hypothetical protein
VGQAREAGEQGWRGSTTSATERLEETMKARSGWQILAVMVCVALLTAPAIAGDVGQGGGKRLGLCVIDGAWIGSHYNPYLYGLMRWTVVHDPDSHWKGTMQLHFVGADGSFGGLFPTVTLLSPTVGSLVRTGQRTFDYTVISYGVDAAAGVPVYIFKNSGTIEVSGHCDVLEVESVAFEFYEANQDPFGSDPPFYGCIPDGTIGFARPIPVDPPYCEP